MEDLQGDAGLVPQEQAPIETPIEASGTLTKTQVVFAIGQAVAALGAVIAFLGLGEQTWIVKVYRFLSDNQAVPVIALIAWIVSSGALFVRNQRRAIERAVLAAMVNNKVGKLKAGRVDPKVQAAIEAAAAKLWTNKP